MTIASESSAMKPWLLNGDEFAEYEGNLVGNRAGLEKLAAAIVAALNAPNGLGKLDGIQSCWAAVELAEHNPEKPKPRTLKEKLVGLTGLFFLVGMFIWPMILGWITIAKWLRN